MLNWSSIKFQMLVDKELVIFSSMTEIFDCNKSRRKSAPKKSTPWCWWQNLSTIEIWWHFQKISLHDRKLTDKSFPFSLTSFAFSTPPFILSPFISIFWFRTNSSGVTVKCVKEDFTNSIFREFLKSNDTDVFLKLYKTEFSFFIRDLGTLVKEPLVTL